MFYKIVKRLFDLFCAFLGIIITSPAWLIAIIGIEISDPGGIFYFARRSGKNGKVFIMFKFRSMRKSKNADEKNFKPDAARIFPFGRFMRATKIDELPQLLNVLIGNMSIVGPRPASVDQLTVTRGGKYAACARLTPGLTSPSALYDYIYGDTVEDNEQYKELVLPTRLNLDLWYTDHAGIGTDMRMIHYTIICVLASVFHTKTPEKILIKLTGLVEKRKTYEEAANV